MKPQLDPVALRQLFTEARTHNGFLDQAVTDEQLQAIWDLAKWGPTSMNCLPMRIVVVRSVAAKERLKPALSEGNIAKTMAAPATLIAATDHGFYERLPQLFPAFPGARDLFAGNERLAEVAAFRNATLQAGYLIMAIRAVGMDAGPMSGFDNAKVDEAFFAGSRVKSNLLINLGYGDVSTVYPRGPRPNFAEDCTIL